MQLSREPDVVEWQIIPYWIDLDKWKLPEEEFLKMELICPFYVHLYVGLH